MVTTIQEVNILQAYIFNSGNGFCRKLSNNDTGYDNWFDAIEILDSNHDVVSPQPSFTNQDFIDWENERIDSIAEELNLETELLTQFSLSNLDKPKVVVAYQILNDLTVVFLNGNTPTADTVYEEFVNRLVGTELENPIKNFVTMMTGITTFGLGISTANKRTIMQITIQFLNSGLIVWLGKNM